MKEMTGATTPTSSVPTAQGSMAKTCQGGGGDAQVQTLSAPIASGQPQPVMDGCVGADNIVCVRSDVSHIAARVLVVTQPGAPITVTTTDLSSLTLPSWSPSCYGTPWHGSTGTCTSDAECPSGACDLATGRCRCTSAEECCSETCTASLCDLDVPTFQTTTPDTVIMLLRCTAPDCSSGDVVAVDDDGNAATPEPLDSRIGHIPTAPGIYVVIVKSFGPSLPARDGRARLRVEWDAGSVDEQLVTFGGRELPRRELRPGDTLFAAKNNDGGGMVADPGDPDFEYHDTTLMVTEQGPGSAGWSGSNCTSSCGRYVFNDDAAFGSVQVLHSRVVVPAGWQTTNGGVTVGVYDDRSPVAAIVNARVLHHRRSTAEGGNWQGPDFIDRDGDGLTWELELALGSCDDRTSPTPLAVGIAGRSCFQFADKVDAFANVALGLTPPNACPTAGTGSPLGCWSARDSDNDGLEDGWEVFAAPFACIHAPSGALHTTGACEPISIHANACPTNKTCLVEPLAARGDPDPTVYDVYVHNLSLRCGPQGTSAKDAGCVAAHNYPIDGDDHALSRTQQLGALRIFAQDAATCEDGSLVDAPASQVCPHDGDGDLRYLMNVHPYDLGALELPDDTPHAELMTGPPQMRAALNHSFHSVMRFGGLSRFALLAHEFHGQARSAPSPTGRAPQVVAQNFAQDSGASLVTWAHEIGHTLSLQHAHDDGGTTAPWGACNSTCTSTPLLCADGSDCAPFRENPVIDSLMSYSQHGMRARAQGAPLYTDPAYDACSFDNSHFSKGYNTPVAEAALQEILYGGQGQHWRNRSLVRTLACYRSLNPYALPQPPPAMCSAMMSWEKNRFAFPGATELTPSCHEPTQMCYVNWDGAGAGPAGTTYAFDVSFGSYAAAAPFACAGDVLEDRDEFLRLMTLGRHALWYARTTEDGHSARDAAIYLASFNRGNAVNNAGWPQAELPVTASGAFASHTFEVNSCATAADCAMVGATCWRDSVCQVDAECLWKCDGGAGVCRCTLDSQCFSGKCDSATGLCLPSVIGRCSCTLANECSSSPGLAVTDPQNPDCPATPGPMRVCKPETFDSATATPTYVDVERPHQEALAFRHTSQTDELRLGRGTNPNALELINLAGSWALRLDVRIDELPQGQTTATIFQSTFGDLTLQSDGNGNITNVAFRPLVPQGSGFATPVDPIMVGGPGFTWMTERWYRILLMTDRTGSPHRFVAAVWPWDLFRGKYGSPACSQRQVLGTQSPVASDDVVFGWNGSDLATRIRATVDNISLQTGVKEVGMDTSGCTVLP